jgi:DNA-binding MarR family transcriptional regulator
MPGKSEAVWEAIEALGRLTDVMDRRREQLGRAVGLSPQQWRVLQEIAREDFMPSLFARAQECTPAAISRVLRQLLERGLVEVSISGHDARRRDYTLTRQGEATLEALRRAREDALDAVWGELDPADLERFAAFGSRLADRLEAYAATAEARN